MLEWVQSPAYQVEQGRVHCVRNARHTSDEYELLTLIILSHPPSPNPFAGLIARAIG
jgi:hypothetical protein